MSRWSAYSSTAAYHACRPETFCLILTAPPQRRQARFSLSNRVFLSESLQHQSTARSFRLARNACAIGGATYLCTMFHSVSAYKVEQPVILVLKPNPRSPESVRTKASPGLIQNPYPPSNLPFWSSAASESSCKRDVRPRELSTTNQPGKSSTRA